MTLLALLTSRINVVMTIPTKAPALSIAALLGVVLWLAERTGVVAALVHLVDQEVWLPLDVFPASVVITGVTTLAHHVGREEVWKAVLLGKLSLKLLRRIYHCQS